MRKKIVTLYIDDASLRLLVTRGKWIISWADLALEPGLVKNGVIIEEAEVAAKIKQLLKTQKKKAKKVLVGVSGLHCLSRPITLPQLPKVMMEEAVRREAKRVLPVPLEQLYLSWQTIAAPEGKIEAFLIAIPCKMADTLLKVLRQAGLKPYLMDLKPLLLTRLVKEATAVIIDVQPTEFDIVIMGDGVPQPIRTISLPSEKLSWQDKLPMIIDELDRTIKFYNSNNPEKPLASTTPIFVSGELAAEPELWQSLSDKFGHPVSLLPSPLECPSGLDSSRYIANIGLVLQKLSPGEEVGPLVVRLNALPAPYRPKPPSLTKVFALPSAAMAIGLIVFLVTLIQGAYADTNLLRGRLESANQKISQRQELENNIAKLEKKFDEAEVSHGNFTAALGSLEKQGDEINVNLEATIQNLATSVSLNSISYANMIFTITGRASNEKEILSYVSALDRKGTFSEITINNITRIGGEGMDFTLILTVGEQN